MAATGQTSAVVLVAFRSHRNHAMSARTTSGCGKPAIYARALDVVPAKLRDAVARRARDAARRGRWFPHSGFIHLDSGPVRNWDLDSAGSDSDRAVIDARRARAPRKMVVNGPAR